MVDEFRLPSCGPVILMPRNYTELSDRAIIDWAVSLTWIIFCDVSKYPYPGVCTLSLQETGPTDPAAGFGVKNLVCRRASPFDVEIRRCLPEEEWPAPLQ